MPAALAVRSRNLRVLLRLCLFSCLTIAAGLSSIAADTKNTKGGPKLVVVVVVDGLPQEQVYKYRDQYGQGGFRRLLDQGAWFGDAHQAHAVTVTAVGHSAVLTGAYPYKHGIIENYWTDRNTLKQIYCTEDSAYTYIGEETKPGSGTSPANLRVVTVGDELRRQTANQSKVVTVSGKDRGAILLAGKTGTAYIYMAKSGRFATSTYYMKEYPDWQKRFTAGNPQDRFYGKEWRPLLDDMAYAGDAPDGSPGMNQGGFPFSYSSKSGKPDGEYYGKLYTGPYLDELTLEFARAAIDGEKLGRNPAGVPDLLGISLSSHDYVNHNYGPESRMSHDHLLRLDRLLASFFDELDKRVGLDNTLVVLTADHGFANTPEYSRSVHRDAERLDPKKMMEALNDHLAKEFGVANLATKWFLPNVMLDYAAMEKQGLRPEQVENAAAQFLQAYPGVTNTFTRSQLKARALPKTRLGMLVQRAWNQERSGDIVVIAKPYWYFSSPASRGATHGSPYAYDSNVPLMLMGKPWIKPGKLLQYAEVVDIAPTLATLLHITPPATSEGRVLTEALKAGQIQ
ncbi:alkaline phosphatase family protein [Undibacterium sp.]|jgi:predicted AlkP superfamily pyrophosphatase or phosphodiesterase|uniref:alkaline phosphatase family protein n=1 Tax=Undibacterium sp. TaxID=1914977 RepID=UPI002BDD58BC|nr:alkaline phosphatase family protein [Undibacterium sp.]HTD06529.1 alkaline phosphatase family protein [Undibacterium sp.]